MTIDATASATTPAQPATTANNTSSSNSTSGTTKTSGSAAVYASQQQLNISIIQESMTVSIKTQNQQMTLLYQSVQVNINEKIQSTLGPNAVPPASTTSDSSIDPTTGQDESPEATAGRIVSMATGLFDLYKKGFPNEDPTTLLNNFMKDIQSGVDTGFGEARNVLQGLGSLSGSISSNIDKTYDLVTKGFADFEAKEKAEIAAEAGVTGEASGSTGSSTDASTGTSTTTTTTTTS